MPSTAVKIEAIGLTDREQVIHSRALTRAAMYREEEAALLNSVDEVDRLRIFEKLGYPNITQYCRKELRLNETLSGYFVMVARKSRQAPELKKAIEQGELSLSTAARVVAVINSENQEQWVEAAKNMTKHELEKNVAAAKPEGKKGRSRLKPVGKNRNRIEFEQSDKFVELVKRAQDLESQRTGRSVSLDETMLAVFEFYLEHRDPIRKAERAQNRAVKTPPCASERRPLFTAAMRHVLNLRDRGQCQAFLPDGKKCGETRWIHFHHIVDLARGGSHDVENVTTLCSACHRRVHEELARMTI